MGRLLFDNRDDAALSRRLRRQAAAGKLIRIHPGIFMEPGGEPETLAIRRNWPQVVAHLFPDGVVTDRSGFDARPIEWEKSETDARYLFVSRPGRPGQFTLPGLVISVRDGIGTVPGEDMPYIGTWIAGPNRKFLDNIMPSRARSGPARTLGRTRVEEKLDELCRDHGEDRLNQIRDAARALAGQIDRQEAFIELDQLIGALLSTRSSPLKTQSGRARAEGRPYDPGCMERLLILSRHLSDHPPPPVQDANIPADRRANSCFIEAYFSNVIEGTEFAVREAEDIVFEGHIPSSRPADGHDVLGTYMKLMDPPRPRLNELAPDRVIDLLRADHAEVMQYRPGISPGQFKQRPNKAGDTFFVSPALVQGTLLAGFEMIRAVAEPFDRALLAHYLVSEVHPFNDGNGRLSRIVMSRELTSAGLCHIPVPRVFRNDYLDALRALTRRNDPDILVRSLLKCQSVAADCSHGDRNQAIEMWARTFAFVEEGKHARFEPLNPSLEIEWRDETPAPRAYWQALEQDREGPGVFGS